MRLLIADDHTLFRDALAQYIERFDPIIEVVLVSDFYQVKDALEKDSAYDLVMLDLRMPGMKGLEGLRYVRTHYPDKAVSLMSGVAETQDVREALDAGAVGYFPKTMSGKKFMGAINQVLEGERFIPIDSDSDNFAPAYYEDEPQGSDGDSHRNGKGSTGDDFRTIDDIGFTPREFEVLSHLLKGESNKEIANALQLQVVTVKLHVRGVCRKLDAKNRMHAAIKAKELGVLEYANAGHK